MLNIDGTLFSAMIISAANHLENHKQMVNDMNVFPVPDGDTGTNMAKTMTAAAQEMLKSPQESLYKAADRAASAALRGARGNSGVILSQFMRGFAKGLGTADKGTCEVFKEAFNEAVNVAYRAVMNPTEGTILTVGRLGAEASKGEFENEKEQLESVINGAREALEKTPDMLPVLKQAGVVDAGGLGLLKILEGAYYALEHGSPVELSEAQETAEPAKVISEDLHIESPFSYCTELIILKESPAKKATVIERELKKIGDCVLVIDDTEFAKIHVHTDHPETVLALALTVGALTDIKIDNMKEQTAKRIETERVPVAFVGVCAGEGLRDILTGLGLTMTIEGGQTMNPSAEDIVNAVMAANGDTVYVFPNNKNIILAANQAVEMVCDCQVKIVPTKTIPQCVAALTSFSPELSVEENFERMCGAITQVETASVTNAVRNTTIGDVEVREGDFIGVTGCGVVCDELSENEAAISALDTLVNEDSSMITIYYGLETTEEKAEQLKEELEEKFEDCDVVCYAGGQPVYHYILSVE
ncbi:MAG: DAK2 domain-containing protein [Ruminococcaceae bacterium]|nr:DAK2 domain-containing protein [Oscillospiraceae bacterium]